jgi:RNA polymerase sigma factor (sigma-70 family)
VTATLIEARDQLADLTDMIGEAARIIAGKFRGFVELDDLVQEGWLWALENRREIDSLLDAGQPLLVRHKICRAMASYGRKERAAWTRTSTEPAYRYTLRTLRRLLPEILPNTDGLPPNTNDEPSVSGGVPAEAGNWEAAWIDVRSAFRTLPEDDRHILWRTYVDEAPSHLIAEEVNLTAAAVRSRATRALKRMQKELGSSPP